MPDPLRSPKQARSRATLDRMRSATEALLVERGGAGPTVEEIVARARTSVGAFYTRYEGKDAAVADVQEQYWDAWRRRWERHLDVEHWAGLRAHEIVAGLIRHLGRSQFRDAQRLRAFWMNALADPDGKLVSRTVALDGHVADAVSRLVVSREPALDPGVVREGFLMVIGAFRDRVMTAATTGGPSEREQRRIIATLTRMYAALLDIQPSVGSYADVLRYAKRAPRFPRDERGASP